MQNLLALLSDSLFNTGPQSFLNASTARLPPKNRQTKQIQNGSMSNSLSSILNILSLLFASAFNSVDTSEDDVKLWRKIFDDSEMHPIWRLDLVGSVMQTSALILRYQMNQKNNKGTINISDSAVIEVLAKLKLVWGDLVPEDSVLPLGIIKALNNIVVLVSNMHSLISFNLQQESLKVFTKLLERIMQSFPYQSQEYLVAMPGSNLSIQSKGNVDNLHISICDLILSMRQSVSSCQQSEDQSDVLVEGYDALFEEAYQFVAAYLDQFVEEIQNERVEIESKGLIFVSQVDSDPMELVDKDIDEDIESDVHVHSASESIPTKGSRVPKSTMKPHDDYNKSHRDDLVKKLFHGTEIMMKSLFVSASQGSGTQSKSLQETLKIFELLHRYFHVITASSISSSAIPGTSNDMPAMQLGKYRQDLKSFLKCFCSCLIQADSLWSLLHDNNGMDVASSIQLNAKLIFSVAISTLVGIVDLLSESLQSPSKWNIPVAQYDAILQCISRLLRLFNKEDFRGDENVLSLVALLSSKTVQLNFASFNRAASLDDSAPAPAEAFVIVDVYYYGLFRDVGEISSGLMNKVITAGDNSLQEYFLQALFDR